MGNAKQSPALKSLWPKARDAETRRRRLRVALCNRGNALSANDRCMTACRRLMRERRPVLERGRGSKTVWAFVVGGKVGVVVGCGWRGGGLGGSLEMKRGNGVRVMTTPCHVHLHHPHPPKTGQDKWREANRRRQWQTVTHAGVMPNLPRQANSRGEEGGGGGLGPKNVRIRNGPIRFSRW